MSEIKAGVDYPKPRATVAGTILSVCLLAGYVLGAAILVGLVR
jgi:hypothetical protein